MQRVSRPVYDTGETYALCISRVRNPDLMRRLSAIRPDIEAASADYVEKAEEKELHLISPRSTIGEVSASELADTYTNRMAMKDQPGRDIYDQIKLLPNNGCCPFCAHRDVSTLDHILPKQIFPVFAVTPVNLVGCCSDCNKAKLAATPSNACQMVLHPYFDDVTSHRWLKAIVIEQSPPALTFHVITVPEWDAILNARITNQFQLLGLAKLYSRQAASEIAGIRHNLQRHFDSGGPNAVRTELEYQWMSRQRIQINSVHTAMYEALAHSAWFYREGFALT